MDVVILYHGTDVASANDIMQYGVDAKRASGYNGTGEFWATTNPTTADWFARVNAANGPPARLRFEISAVVLQSLLAAVPVVARNDGPEDYEFLPGSFAILNQDMSGQHVATVV